ncbi:hypothetical protein [Pseudomonas shirazensis]|uniref:hypothetical protein n=1 Tax=Pseudomonas shirazensis TaxID=2745494 RepID=UPI003D2A67B9
MSNYESAQALLKDFAINPPTFDDAVEGTLEFAIAPARNPLTANYPGFDGDIPGLERVTIIIAGDRWGSGTSLTAEEARSQALITGSAPGAVLREFATYRVWMTVHFKIDDEDTDIVVRSADGFYKLVRP